MAVAGPYPNLQLRQNLHNLSIQIFWSRPSMRGKSLFRNFKTQILESNYQRIYHQLCLDTGTMSTLQLEARTVRVKPP